MLHFKFLNLLLLIMMLMPSVPVLAASRPSEATSPVSLETLPRWVIPATTAVDVTPATPCAGIGNGCTAETDLSVSKSFVEGEGIPGGTVRYQITVKNVGDAVARNVVVTDTWYSNMTYVSAENEYGFTATQSNNTVVWRRSAVNPGESVELYLTLRLPTTLQAGEILTNVVRASTSDLDLNASNDVYTLTHQAGTDLGLVVYSESYAWQAPRGEDLVYRLQLSHYDSFRAMNTRLTNTLPMSVSLLDWSSNNDWHQPSHTIGNRVITPTQNGNRLVWDIGELSRGSYNIYLRVHVSDSLAVKETITNVVTVTCALDQRASNNVITTTFTVYTPTRDVYVNAWLGSNAGDIIPGSEVEFVSYVGSGSQQNAPAYSTTLTFTLPSSATFVSWSSLSYKPDHTLFGHLVTETISGNQIIFPIGIVRSDDAGNIYVTVRLTDTIAVGSQITATYLISSAEQDASPINNQAQVGVTVVSPTVDMHVSKNRAYNSSDAVPGGEFIYSIFFANYGNITAHDVLITDTLPPGAIYQEWSEYSWATSHRLLGREITVTVTGDTVVWHIGDVEADQYDTIYLTVRVANTVPVGSSLVNQVYVTTREHDPNTANDASSYILSVVTPTVNLRVSKGDWSSNDPVAGGTFKYKIYVRNDGTTTATNVIITDTLPPSMTLDSWSGYTYNPYETWTGKLTWHQQGNQIVWYVGTLRAGQYGYIYPKVTISDTAPVRTPLCNYVQISTEVTETDYTDNTDAYTTSTYYPIVDLYVDKQLASPMAGTSGGEMKYRLYFGNLGNVVAPNVVLTDVLPPGVSFTSWYGYIYNPSVTDWEESVRLERQGDLVIWHLGNVQAGQYGYIYLTVRISDSVPVGSVLTNTLAISSDGEEWIRADNTNTLTTTVLPPQVDLSVNVYSWCAGAPDGESKYSVSIYNYGNVSATNMLVTATLPVSTSVAGWYEGWSDSGFTLVTQTETFVVWRTPALAPSQYANLLFYLHFYSGTWQVGDTAVVTVGVGSDQQDADLTNNVAQYSSTLEAKKVFLDISKYAPSQAAVGGNLDYSLYIENVGNAEAHNLAVTDTLPLSVAYKSWRAYNDAYRPLSGVTTTVSSTQILWRFDSLSACSSIYIYLSAQVSYSAAVGSVLTNIAESSAGNMENSEPPTATASSVVVTPTAITSITLEGPVSSTVGAQTRFTATVSPSTATTPINYEWWTDESAQSSIVEGKTQVSAYLTWNSVGLHWFTVTARNAAGTVTATRSVTIEQGVTTPVTDVAIIGPRTGQTDTPYSFKAVITPANATPPINYTWTPTPSGGAGGYAVTYTWATSGTKLITVVVQNAGGIATATHRITIEAPAQCTALAGVTVSGPTSGYTDTAYTFNATTTPTDASTPITYAWTPEPAGGQGTASATYSWATTGTKTITITASNCGGTVTATHIITVEAPQPTCPKPLREAAIAGPTQGTAGTAYTFTAVITPVDATAPVTYTWSPAPSSGQGTALATYNWPTAGTRVVTLVVANCGGILTVTHRITISAQTVCVGLADVTVDGSAVGYTNTAYTFDAVISPTNASTPIAYTWSPEPDSGQGTASATYSWATTGTKTITITASNCGGTVTTTHTIVITSGAPTGGEVGPDGGILTYT